MGADLYIEKIHIPLVKKYQPLFDAAIQQRNSVPKDSPEWEAAQRKASRYLDLMYEQGYFRDSYNATSLLNRLGLSWWTDVIPLCTENGILNHVNLQRFRNRVANAQLKLPSKAELLEDYGKVDDEGENSLEAWHSYFTGKHAKLLAFLDLALEVNSPIRCSL